MLEQLSLSWLQQVADLPINWALCAVSADKRPYHPDNQKGQGWQLSGLERSRFVTLNGHFAAVGLLTGPLSGGLVAIDHDGHSADEKIEELSGVAVAEALPITVGFTSQRDGRYQLLYSIPEELWRAVKTRKYPTGTKAADSGKGEALEFRWAGAQSVILGAHPTTAGYRWLDGRSPWEVEVAPAPDWIIMAMRDETPEHVAIARTEWQMERPLETPIPLINLATKKHRQHINEGVGEGSRNDAGAAIARDLIGCEQWAISSNVYFDGNAKALFWQFAQRSGLSESEAKTIWRSAERGTPHPACSDEGLQSVLKSWERKNGSKMTQKKAEGNGDVAVVQVATARTSHLFDASNLPAMSDEVLGTLTADIDPFSCVYYQGASSQHLCRVLKDPKRPSVVEILNHDLLKNAIDNKMNFGFTTSKKIVWKDCPLVLSKHIATLSRWPQLNKLSGISSIPLLMPDGTISCTPGYDEKSEYLLEFNPKDFKFLTNPTKDDAIKSLQILKDLIKESEFKNDIDRSGALAMFLTAVSRKLYDTAPMFAVDATRSGIGKGTLVAMVTAILTGNKSSGTIVPFNPDPDEFRKALLTNLMEGLPILNIDNVKNGELGGAVIESALTNTDYKDRVLGATKNIYVSTQILWTANGNNLRMSKDMQRRSIIIRLDSNVQNLDERNFSKSSHELDIYLRKNRPKFISAALTVVQAFIQAAPVMDWPKPLGSYSEWDAIVRRCLLWLGEPDPVLTQKAFAEDDDTEDTFEVLLSAWHGLHEAKEVVFKDLMSVVAPSQYGKTEEEKTLEEALKPICFDYRSQNYNSEKLGKYLRDHKGGMAGGYKLVRGKKSMHGVLWSVEKKLPVDELLYLDA